MSIRKKIIVVLCIITLFCGVGFAVWQHVSSQSRGVGTVLSAKDVADRLNVFDQSSAQFEALQLFDMRAESTPIPNSAPIEFSILRFQLPDGYDIRPSQDSAEHLQRLVALNRRDGLRRLTIFTEIRSKLDELPAVQLRRHSPQVYKEERVIVAGNPGIAFTSTTEEHYEKVVFVQRGTLIISFAVSTEMVFVADVAKHELDAVLTSVEWLQ